MIADRVAVLMHDHAIHLVVDLNDLDITTDTLSVHFVSTQTAPSAVKFETGGVRVITLGPAAFANAAVLHQEIETQLQAAAPLPNLPGPAPTVLDPMDAQIVALLNSNKIADPRSVMIIQGLLTAPIDGVWSAELVQRVAGFQQLNGIPANGLIEDKLTLPAMVARLKSNNENDAILRLIVDFYDFAENGNLISVYFDPTMGTGKVAFAGVRRDAEQAGSIQVGPEGMNQPFEGIVHTLAHEMEHIRQLTGGPAASATREFLAHSIGVMAEGIPEEADRGPRPDDEPAAAVRLRQQRPPHRQRVEQDAGRGSAAAPRPLLAGSRQGLRPDPDRARPRRSSTRSCCRPGPTPATSCREGRRPGAGSAARRGGRSPTTATRRSSSTPGSPRATATAPRASCSRRLRRRAAGRGRRRWTTTAIRRSATTTSSSLPAESLTTELDLPYWYRLPGPGDYELVVYYQADEPLALDVPGLVRGTHSSARVPLPWRP